MLEEAEAPRSQRRMAPVVLESMGIGELQEYIGELQAEIRRVEAVIAQKHSHRGAAESVFKT